MKIQITQEDIDTAKRNSFSGCPIARSLGRMGYSNVSVNVSLSNSDLSAIFYTDMAGKRHNLVPSQSAIDFVRKVDTHKALTPVELTLA